MVLQLLRSLSVVVFAIPFVENLPSTVVKNLDNQVAIYVALTVIIAGNIAIFVGLFLLKRWAWIAVMILIGSNLLFGILVYWNGGQPFAAMLIDVISVFYLNLRNVQAAFEPRSATSEAIA
ncbi:MAG: hypothetical protein R2844_06820 [Caldilineales bacterium]